MRNRVPRVRRPAWSSWGGRRERHRPYWPASCIHALQTSPLACCSAVPRKEKSISSSQKSLTSVWPNTPVERLVAPGKADAMICAGYRGPGRLAAAQKRASWTMPVLRGIGDQFLAAEPLTVVRVQNAETISGCVSEDGDRDRDQLCCSQYPAHKTLYSWQSHWHEVTNETPSYSL